MKRIPILFFFFASMCFGGEVSEKAICSAAWETLFHNKPIYVHSKKEHNHIGEIAIMHYFRSRQFGDLVMFRIAGNRIHWAKVGGRWRTDPADERVFYRIGNRKIIITIVHGDDRIQKEYPLQ